MGLDDSGGDAHRGHMGREIMGHDRAGPDDRPLPDGHTVNNGRARDYVATCSDTNIPGHYSPWVNVCVVSHACVMRNRCPDIDNAMASDPDARGQDAAWGNTCARPNAHFATDMSSGMAKGPSLD